MKFANIKLNRKDGPVFTETKGISEDEKNNILVFGLPIGEAKNGSFKLVTLKDNFYVSYTELDEDNNGNAAVIGIDIKEDSIRYNPFNLFLTLKEMVHTQTIPEINTDEIDTNQFNEPYSSDFVGGEYLISSMFLLERIIIVGSHQEIIKFLGTLYEAAPIQSIPYLNCVTLVKSISDKINIQGVEIHEDILEDLDSARTDSTIVILEENEAYGTKTSPFSKEIAQLYLEGKFEETRKKVADFVALASGEQIISSSDFAKVQGINKTDAKLLKQLQLRMEEIRELRKTSIYYKGVD